MNAGHAGADGHGGAVHCGGEHRTTDIYNAGVGGAAGTSGAVGGVPTRAPDTRSDSTPSSRHLTTGQLRDQVVATYGSDITTKLVKQLKLFKLLTL